MTITVNVADLDPYYFYGVCNKTVGKDANERITLAKWCVEHDMFFSRAKAQMDMPKSIDAKAVEEFMKTEFPKINEGIAAKLMRAAKRRAKRAECDAREAKNLSKVKAGFERAANSFDGAVKTFDALPSEVRAENAELRAEAVQGAVRAHLSFAHTMSSRGSYVKATKYCNLASAIDPDNAEAKSARATIAATASGWNRRGFR